ADRGAEHADRAQRRAHAAPGPAEREREGADRQGAEVAQARTNEAPAGHAEQRHVGARIAADDLGVPPVDLAIVARDAYGGAVRRMEARADHEVARPRDPGATVAVASSDVDDRARGGGDGRGEGL